ncbi:uncharacterized protein LOC106174235 isoform X2 [Lingula anatina]|uniref:Uncharacterized protein LOC106174235 isoform X2 n=1 Tax=Lingula anatina TaxID=7574 RepID=A0A1S3JL55_LINAN|nr:uncharacterized protein LOC106174235 isoform X2 [Lingula anatina]|eukprot:XP_013411140.1 uncharacterized protein LOC106174235 isoform X2 [Lingula anatina]
MWILEGSASELNGLVEDKEIAAQAVAFVVSSTRKGIVPLCSDVAKLLRQKKSLEQKVTCLKHENSSLRSSCTGSFRTSHSTSPTPPSFNSFSASLQEQGIQTQDGRQCCSHCSSASSSASPKLDKLSHNSNISSPNSDTSYRSPQHHRHHNNHHHSNQQNLRHHRRKVSASSSNESLHITTAEVHNPPTSNGIYLSDQKEQEEEKDSPEMIHHSEKGSPAILPSVSRVSTEVQCQIPSLSDQKLEKQFKETVIHNSKLAEELGAAKKEIEILKGRLKEFEMNSLARMYTEVYHVENELHHLANGDVEETPSESSAPTATNLPSPTHKLQVNHNNNYKPPIPRKPLPPVLVPGPLAGCKCEQCEGADSQTVQTGLSSKMAYSLGDHVVVKGDRTGHIRYIGHLDNLGQADMVFIGLELDAPVGRHDGFFNYKRYFSCHKDHGIFVPIQDVLCEIGKKNSPKKSQPQHTEMKRKTSNPETSPTLSGSGTKSTPKRDKTGSSDRKVSSADGLRNLKFKRDSPMSIV